MKPVPFRIQRTGIYPPSGKGRIKLSISYSFPYFFMNKKYYEMLNRNDNEHIYWTRSRRSILRYHKT